MKIVKPMLFHRTLPRSLHWLVAKEKADEIVPWVRSAEKWSYTKIDILKAKRDNVTGKEFLSSCL